MADTDRASQPGSIPALATFLLLLALNLLNYIDRYILPGEVSLIQKEFGLTDQQVGALGRVQQSEIVERAPASRSVARMENGDG